MTFCACADAARINQALCMRHCKRHECNSIKENAIKFFSAMPTFFFLCVSKNIDSPALFALHIIVIYIKVPKTMVLPWCFGHDSLIGSIVFHRLHD